VSQHVSLGIIGLRSLEPDNAAFLLTQLILLKRTKQPRNKPLNTNY